jgi:hypothetical protein
LIKRIVRDEVEARFNYKGLKGKPREKHRDTESTEKTLVKTFVKTFENL